MTIKEKVKKELDRLSDADLEKVYLYISTLNNTKKTRPNIPSLRLNGKLDKQDIRSLAYE